MISIKSTRAEADHHAITETDGTTAGSGGWVARPYAITPASWIECEPGVRGGGRRSVG